MTSTGLLAAADLPSFGEFPTLTGRQEAEHRSEFPGDDRLGIESLTLSARISDAPMPWQVNDHAALLRIDTGTGLWTHPSACLLVPRQNGKSDIVLKRCLYGLVVLDEVIVYSTQRWTTARKLGLRLISMIKARPSLAKRLAKKPTTSGGQVQIKMHRIGCPKIGVSDDCACRAEILLTTRSNDAGRGLDDVDVVVYDEAYNLTEGEIAALSLTQMAARNPQTIYMSSAVNVAQHANGQVLAGIRQNGLRGVPGLFFAEYMAPEGLAADDPETWRLANPSYGVIQTEAKVRGLLTGFATAEGRRAFEVEVLGWGDWPVNLADIKPLITQDAWRDMKDLTPELTGAPVIALERSPVDRSVWTFVAAQRGTGGRAHLELRRLVATDPTVVVDRIVDLVTAWDPPAFVMRAGSEASELLPLLMAQGIEPHLATTAEVARACGGFLDSALAGQVSHTGQQLLATAVANTVKKELQRGGFVWDAVVGSPYADLMGATMAHWGLLTFGVVAKKGTSVAPRTAATHTHSHTTDFDAMSAAF